MFAIRENLIIIVLFPFVTGSRVIDGVDSHQAMIENKTKQIVSLSCKCKFKWSMVIPICVWQDYAFISKHRDPGALFGVAESIIIILFS